MALIKCPDCGKEVSDAAPACPNCGRPILQTGPAAGQAAPAIEVKETKRNRLAKGCLITFLVFVGLWIIGTIINSNSSSNKQTSSPVSTRDTPSPAVTGPQLELVKWDWQIDSGYAIAEGQVKNISSLSLRNVQAVVTFKDADGGFITSDDALIDYNPILPGQTSPFKVMARENPAMKKALIEFKHLMGGTIEFQDTPKK